MDYILIFVLLIPFIIGFGITSLVRLRAVREASRTHRRFRVSLMLAAAVIPGVIAFLLYAWLLVVFGVLMNASVPGFLTNAVVHEAWLQSLIPSTLRPDCFSTLGAVCERAVWYSIPLWNATRDIHLIPFGAALTAGGTSLALAWHATQSSDLVRRQISTTRDAD